MPNTKTLSPSQQQIAPAKQNALAVLGQSEEVRHKLLADSQRTEQVARRQHDMLVEGLPRLEVEVQGAIGKPQEERVAIERAYLGVKENIARLVQVIALCQRQQEQLGATLKKAK